MINRSEFDLISQQSNSFYYILNIQLYICISLIQCNIIYVTKIKKILFFLTKNKKLFS